MTGRELDALVAEKVMGGANHCWFKCPSCGSIHFGTNFHNGKRTCHDGCGGEFHPADAIPEFSRDISSAWEVVEKMASGGFGAFSLFERREGWRAGWVAGGADADTVPRAICLAALKAVGVEAA